VGELMFEKLKDIDHGIYVKFEDIEKNISTFSRSVYVSMQAYCEAVTKNIIKKEKISFDIERRDSLGPLLMNAPFKRVLELKLNFNNLDSLFKINNLGNQYKHETSIYISEEDIYKLMTIIFELSNSFLVYYNIKQTYKIDKQYFENLLNRYKETVSKKELDQTLDQKNEEIDVLKKELKVAVEDKEVFKTKLSKINDTKSAHEKTKEQIEQIKKDLIKINQNISNFDEESLDLLDKGIKNNKDKIEKINEKIINFEKERNEKLATLNELNKSLEFDKQTRDEIKYKTLILDLEDKIIKLEARISDEKNVTKKYTAQEPKKNDYNSRSSYLNYIRNSNESIKFDSNYVIDGEFELTGINFRGKSISKYSSYYAVLFNLLNRGRTIRLSEKLLNLKLDREKISKIYQLQIGILTLIKNGYLSDDNIELGIDKENSEIFQLAFDEIVKVVDNLTVLSNVKYIKPKLKLVESSKINILFDSPTSLNNTLNIKTHNFSNKETNFSLWIDKKIDYNIEENDKDQVKVLNELLNYIFGFKEFKNGQIPIFANFLKNRNTIGILPTGGGKSLTYYMSVLLQPKVSLVVAPINSLIKDQKDKLTKLFNINSLAVLNSENKEYDADLLRFKSGKVLFTFATPERIQNTFFRGILISLNESETIGSVILDEVHCLSEWGHDFRVSYLMLSNTLNYYCSNVKYLGLTATASVNVVKDLVVELKINDKQNIIFSKKLKRENLNFKIDTVRTLEEGIDEIETLLKTNYNKNTIYDISKNGEKTNSGIIFCQTAKFQPNSVEKVHERLSSVFDDEVSLFYGENKENQDAFMDNDVSLLVATKAFGMGVDKPNIRFTIHYGMPSSREAFYQEAGRAGRDGKKSDCRLISSEIPDYHQDKINSFLRLDTPIVKLKDIQESMKTKLDIRTNFYFLLESVDEPNVEAKNAINFLVKIKNNMQNFKHVEIINKRNYLKDSEFKRAKNKTEFVLYTLHKLGIVDDWAVDYTGYYEIRFSLDINHRYNDINYIKERTLNYMMPYSPNPRDVKFIEEIKNISQLEDLVIKVKSWYHETFIRARREQLSNMYSFIQRFKGTGKSDTIQNELDQFFDLSQLIGTTDQGYSLTFDNNSFEEVVKFAFDVESKKLVQMKITLERLLESTSNMKVDLYTALIHLRIGEYETNRNGKERLEYFLKQASQAERNETIGTLLNYFTGFTDNQKSSILSTIYDFDSKYLEVIYDKFNKDEQVLGLVVHHINKELTRMGVK
jgi:ATP-dependent DNA helicase RecQ